MKAVETSVDMWEVKVAQISAEVEQIKTSTSFRTSFLTAIFYFFQFSYFDCRFNFAVSIDRRNVS